MKKTWTLWEDIYFMDEKIIEQWGEELAADGFPNEFCYIDELNREYLEDERLNLNIEVGGIIAIADLGLWNGRRIGYKYIGGKISDCLYSDCDYNKWYVDGYNNLKSINVHHDGRNLLLYRILKPTLTPTQKENFEEKLYNGKVTKRDISRYTLSVGAEVRKVYGF